LSTEDLQSLLRCRKLSKVGSHEELQQRLAAFMTQPAACPEADCRPSEVLLVGGRLFANKQQLRRHVQQLMRQLDEHENIEPGHPHFAFLSGLLERHPRYAEKVGLGVNRYRC
jgi:hypothetical protein